jgi:hypothetical protein
MMYFIRIITQTCSIETKHAEIHTSGPKLNAYTHTHTYVCLCVYSNHRNFVFTSVNPPLPVSNGTYCKSIISGTAAAIYTEFLIARWDCSWQYYHILRVTVRNFTQLGVCAG